MKAACRKQFVTWSAVLSVFYFNPKIELINNLSDFESSSVFVNMPPAMYFNLESILATADKVVVSRLNKTHDSVVRKEVVINIFYLNLDLSRL